MRAILAALTRQRSEAIRSACLQNLVWVIAALLATTTAVHSKTERDGALDRQFLAPARRRRAGAFCLVIQ